jgi:hypothetical protein
VLRVAGPSLEGGQVAVLRLHAASTGHVTSAPYSCERGERITQLQYFLQLSWRTSENPQNANFYEKALFVKPTWRLVSVAECNGFCPSRYASIRTSEEPHASVALCI